VPDVTEATCLGTALLAGVAAEVHPDLRSAVARAVRLERRVMPQAGRVASYDARYALYRQVHPTVIDLQRQL
jgi:ribulose kinase